MPPMARTRGTARASAGLSRRSVPVFDPALRDQFAAWRGAAEGIGDLPDGALAACMLTYSRLHGAIVLELVGHTPPQLTDYDALFNMQMEHTTDSLHPLSWAPSPTRRR
jgi:hypothetical protein